MLTLLPIAIGVATMGASLAVGGEANSNTTQGFYTEEQATEGAALYEAACASCHGKDLSGTYETPGLTGKFIRNWAGKPVGALFAYVSDAMPQMAPGTLSPEDNANIVAYLLKMNGLSAGAHPLIAEKVALDGIQFTPANPVGK